MPAPLLNPDQTEIPERDRTRGIFLVEERNLLAGADEPGGSPAPIIAIAAPLEEFPICTRANMCAGAPVSVS
jgi:hypothetical protein